ncbi:MAG: tRNA preQ1(34) S-adenosylmethionine ribosyltransferase-isomerase QueA [Amoebophilaceae bacterium]|jgi:S-adenosylmethionine:tRNA ribosyltransferase-isomerase|nr:tRNA preQ1(34) S-adenosylmethionine ribosyltransferase-isomerase QueA [Amoebophilaceae bacterium]
MKLSSFKFDLPSKLISPHPAANRDEARLMVVHKDTGKIEHKHFKDVIDYLSEDDVLVVNDTKVFSALLYGSKEKTGAPIEVLLLRELNGEHHLWDALVDPARKIRVGNKLFFGDGELVAEVLDNTTSRGRTLKFLFDGTTEDLHGIIEQLGNTPLPKEIKRKVIPEDRSRYQTVYAQQIGAVVAPTAGLHFTPHLLKRLELQGIHIASLTLHIGLGSLRPVDVEDLTKYKVDSEFMSIHETVARVVNQALNQRKRVCAVGVSTAKAIESSVSAAGGLKASHGWTNKFIFPPYPFRVCTSLITNFHLPASAPLMTAAALGGYDLIMEAYQLAVKEKYRFFVYGDAMLIL